MDPNQQSLCVHVAFRPVLQFVGVLVYRFARSNAFRVERDEDDDGKSTFAAQRHHHQRDNIDNRLLLRETRERFHLILSSTSVAVTKLFKKTYLRLLQLGPSKFSATLRSIVFTNDVTSYFRSTANHISVFTLGNIRTAIAR